MSYAARIFPPTKSLTQSIKNRQTDERNFSGWLQRNCGPRFSITDKCHPRFELQPRFRKGDTFIRAITYTADFSYIRSDGKTVIEEVKPFNAKKGVFIIEQAARLRHKMFEYKYPELTLTIVQ